MTIELKASPGAHALCPLVLASDDAYGMPLATTLRSIADTNPGAWPIHCYVLSNGITEETKRRVVASLPENSTAIHWLPVELSGFGSFRTLSHISKMTYARFLISQMLPPDLSRVLYLDCDLLVVGDLLPLCRAKLGDAVLGAVADPFMDPAIKQNRAGYELVPRVQNYFNAGVLLIDLERWREQRISGKAIQYLEDRPDTPYSDQDALNVACDGRWKPLESRWNVQRYDRVIHGESVDANGPAIIHFTTEEKPWIAKYLSPSAAFYDAYRSRTCFARTGWDGFVDVGIRSGVSFRVWLSQWTLLRSIWRSIKRTVRYVASRGKPGSDRRRSHSLTS